MYKKRKGILLVLFFSLPLFVNAQRYSVNGDIIHARVDAVNITITFYGNNTVRILKQGVGQQNDTANFSVVAAARKTSVKTEKNRNELVMTGDSLIVKLDLLTGCIEFCNLKGGLLLSERSGSSDRDAAGEVKGYQSVFQSFAMDSTYPIYGLGQHLNGIFDQRNQQIVLRQKNMQVSMPFFQCPSAGFGLFWDNYSATIYKDSSGVVSFRSKVGNAIDYYFMEGSNPDQIIRGLRLLTGRAPMLPLWAFGYWQSKERYKTQTEILGVVKKYRALGVPLDVIIQDWQYWGDNSQWNSMRFVRSRYPDPKGMIEEIHKLHAHIGISVWPAFGYKTALYKQLKKEGLLFKLRTFPDTTVKLYNAFSRKARDIYWASLNEHLFKIGIDGWWLDSTEPEIIDSLGRNNIGTAMLPSIMERYRNAYPLLTCEGVYRHQRASSAKKRVVILTRSAFVGQQRFGTIVWSGDTQGSWKSLKNQITGGLNFSMSGMPYWTTDIGGFFPGAGFSGGAENPLYQELYVRWLQFESFLPVMRSHGTGTPREIYQFGAKGYWAYDVIDEFIDLRYRLLPYIYSADWLVTTKSATMMRPLVMDFNNDQAVWAINSEFMLGKSMLICPVTTSLVQRDERDTVRAITANRVIQKVYLPKGVRWYDFWTGARLNGGQYMHKKAPIGIIPVYIKAGSILPMGPFEQYAGASKDSILEVRIYGGRDGGFTLYEDSGDGYNYEKGDYSTITFSWNEKRKELTIGGRNGRFYDMLKDRIFRIVLVDKYHGYGDQISDRFDKVVRYNGMARVVKL